MSRILNPNGPMQPMQAQMQIAAPLNDTQLVALMSVHLEGSVEDRVRLAMELVAEAIVQMPTFTSLVLARKQAMEQAVENELQ